MDLYTIDTFFSKKQHLITNDTIAEVLSKANMDLSREDKIIIFEKYGIDLLYNWHRYEHGENSYKVQCEHPRLFKKAKRNEIDPKNELFTYQEYKDFLDYNKSITRKSFIEIKKHRVLNIFE